MGKESSRMVQVAASLWVCLSATPGICGFVSSEMRGSSQLGLVKLELLSREGHAGAKAKRVPVEVLFH